MKQYAHIWSRVLLAIVIVVMAAVICCVLPPVLSTITTIYDTSPAWSLNGRAIVFVCYRPAPEVRIDLAELVEPKPYYGDIPYKPQDAEICTMAPDGTIRRQLTHNRASDYDPIWSPDGTQIAFISDREGDSDLYVMKADGSQQRRVAHVGAVGNQVWSPDGERIAFLKATSYAYVLTVLDIATGYEKQLVEGQIHFPAWSPDDEVITYIVGYLHQGKCEVHSVEVKTGNESTLPIMSACNRLAWSPDGTRLGFVGSETGLRKNVLFVLSLQTLEAVALTKGDEAIGDGLVWSPEGGLVFYPAKGEIFAARSDGSTSNQVTSLGGSLISFLGKQNLALSPDGKQLAFMRGEGAQAPADSVKIWTINSDGSGLRRLSP
jgi:Tol biopolymer transport system component